MESPAEFGEGYPAPGWLHAVHLVLGWGFRGHTVAVSMDAEEVFRAVRLTTDPLSARAGVLTVDGSAGTTCFAVTVTPGNLMAAFEVDTAAHPQVTIHLLGEGTVAFEASAVSYR